MLTTYQAVFCPTLPCCAELYHGVLCCGVLQDVLLGLLFDESVLELALLVCGQVDARRFKEDAPLIMDLLAAVYQVRHTQHDTTGQDRGAHTLFVIHSLSVTFGFLLAIYLLTHSNTLCVWGGGCREDGRTA